MSEDMQTQRSPTLTVLPVVLFNFLIYFVIGLPNAVIGAMFVHETLGFPVSYASTTITLQYLGTCLTRLVAGQLVDKYGPKRILTYGMSACIVSGVLMSIAAMFPDWFGVDGHMSITMNFIALGIVLLSRLFIGWAESWTATSVTAWNMRRVGVAHTSVAISWNGVTTYGGIALGAAMGSWIGGSLMSGSPTVISNMCLLPVGLLAVLIPVIALLILAAYKGIKPLPRTAGEMPFLHAVRKVLPYGAGLAAGSFGFGTVNAFLALYYDSQHYAHYKMTFIIFAVIFVAVRILFSDQIDKRGGMIVARISLLTEFLAMLVYCLAYNLHSEILSCIATAMTGGGFSLLFPALGTMATRTGGPEYGGILIAAYSVFTDLTIFIVGPLMGFIRDKASWPVMFGVVGIFCFSGIILASLLSRIPGCGVQDDGPVA